MSTPTDRSAHKHSILRLGIGLFFQYAFAFISKLIGERPFDPEAIEIARQPLAIPRLDAAFNGYRIVQISDIHMGTWMNEERLSHIVEMVNQLEPDLIAITGDFISYTVERPLQEIIGPLSRLAPKDLTLAVLGNHDHWTDAQQVRNALAASSVHEIGNDVYTLRRGAAVLHVAGVDSFSVEQDRLDLVLEKLPADGPAILLAHEPDFADTAAATGRFALQLSGHSHGGQIHLPLIGPPMLPTNGRKYPHGLYRVKGMHQYTNRGLGSTSLRLRLNCPQEITVLTLETED